MEVRAEVPERSTGFGAIECDRDVPAERLIELDVGRSGGAVQQWLLRHFFFALACRQNSTKHTTGSFRMLEPLPASPNT
jgi:hypothetical protein